MIENFTTSLDFVFRHECAYAPGHYNELAYVISEDVPGDSGGLTKFGIDASSHPGLDIENLTRDQASQIYRDGEWARCRCDALPGKIDTAVFDCAVNNGIAVSGILLQRALIQCRMAVVVDGEIGQATERAALACPNPTDLKTRLLALRRKRYSDLVLHNPRLARFLKGWLARVDDLEQFLFQ